MKQIIYSLPEVLVKTLTLMLLIQILIHFLHPQLDLAHGIYWKKTFNIDGTTIHSSLSIYFSSLSLE
jgi:hypothetical protein